MEQAVQWIALAATTVAAIMVAANGGARLTGYGFIVFSMGSVAWSSYGWTTGQNNLLIQNAILLAINLVGIWRWLGRAARYQDGARAADEQADIPLVAASSLPGMTVIDRNGEKVGVLVDAMMSGVTGKVIYATISVGGLVGVGEKLLAVPWYDLRLSKDRIEVNSVSERLHRAQGVVANAWPTAARPDWDGSGA